LIWFGFGLIWLVRFCWFGLLSQFGSNFHKKKKKKNNGKYGVAAQVKNA